MKRTILLTLAILFLISFSSYPQTKSKYGNVPGQVMVKIVEDYSFPSSDMWEEKKYTLITKIENGMYVSTAKDPYEPALEFHSPDQKIWCYRSDMEFVIVGEGQAKSDLIHVQVKPNGEASASRELTFNKKGEWGITGHNGSPVYKKGKLKAVANSNTIRVVHRRDTLKYYFNDEYLGDHVLDKSAQIWWKGIRIFQDQDKGSLALDKVTLIAYYDKLAEDDLDKEFDKLGEDNNERKKEEEEKARVAAIAKAEEEKKWKEEVNAYKRDKAAEGVMAVFDKYQNSHRDKVKKVLGVLKGSMEMDKKNEFVNRKVWTLYASNDLPSGAKTIRDDVAAYRSELGKLGLKTGENQLNDRLTAYLESVLKFASATEGWAETIGDRGVSNDSILASITRLEEASGPMRERDLGILGFVRLYKAGNGLK
jgi:hypothetical protein